MAIVNIFLTILIVIAVFIITGKVMKRHPYYGKVKLSLGAPKALLLFTALMFVLTCVWQFALEMLDEMRTPDFWIGVFSADPVLSDVFQTANEYDVDLGIPTSEYGEDALIMISNVMESFATTFWLAIAGLVIYAIYILGIFKRSRVTLYVCLVVFGAIFIFAGRTAGSGVIHLVNWATSGIYNPYNGDLSDSVMLPFYTVVAAIITVITIIAGIPKINKFMTYATSTPPVTRSTIEESHTKQNAFTDSKAVTIDIFASDDKSKVEKLTELKTLLDAGILTEEEFTNIKHQILKS